MAGRGMGIATQGGGCVSSGPKNKMVSKTSKKTGPVMMKDGGDVKIDMMPEDTPAEREYKRAMAKDTPAEREYKRAMAKAEAEEDLKTGAHKSKIKAMSKRYGGTVKKMRKGGMC